MPPDTDRVRVYDPENAALLASGRECCDAGGELHTFTCECGNGALLAYYFGKGKRSVLVRTGRNEGAAAHLGTRWRNGHREWTLDW